MIKVTVYIPTHNRLHLLKRAVASVEQQTWENIELIVVDDASSDGTPQWLEEQAKLGRLVFLRNSTAKGACFSRNRAIAVATGTYITGLDDDDALQPERISRLVKKMQGGAYSCVTSSIVEHRRGGRIARPYNIGVVTLEQLLHSNKLGNQVLTKTEYLKAVGGFDETFPAFQDYDTWVRLVAQFGDAYKLPNLDYIWYTDHEMERISTVPTKRLQAFEQFVAKHEGLMNAKHKKSMALLKISLSGQPVQMQQLFSLAHRDNLRMVLALFFNQHLAPIKKRIDQWRMS